MRRAIFLLLSIYPLFLSGVLAQLPGLRVMPPAELTLRADLIVRGRVIKVEKANYRATYSQLATLEVKDTIKGDTRLKEIKVWGSSSVIYANDTFSKGEDLIIFLVREQTFYRTLNYQHGRFLINLDTVKSWRQTLSAPPTAPPNGTANPVNSKREETNPLEPSFGYELTDKSYSDVRKEIEAYLREGIQINK